MSVVETQIHKYLKRLDEGLLSRNEVAQGLLYGLMVGRFLPDQLCSVLPVDVMLDLRQFLHQLKETGYRWKPFLIGEQPSMTAEEVSARLKDIDERISACALSR